ncbi:gas vesicle protein GvpG [Kitasatospora sp. NPDC001159]
MDGPIVLLPAAPLWDVGCVLGKVVQAAEQEVYDPGPVQEELTKLERGGAYQRGGVHAEQLLQRLEEIRAHQLCRTGQ